MNCKPALFGFLLAGLLGSTPLFGQTHEFTPVEPTGLPYHVIINQLTISPAISTPFELGLFADTLCVGRGVSTGENNIDIVAWQGDPGFDLAGFNTGDTILVKIATQVFDTLQIMNGLVTPVTGNGTFGDGTYAVIDVAAGLDAYPAIQIPPANQNLAFGNIYLGDSAVDSIIVHNTGSAGLSVYISSVPAGFAVNLTNFTLAAGDSQQVVITFQPDIVRAYDDFLSFYSNDPLHPRIDIRLRGLGARPPTGSLLIRFDPQAFNRVPTDRPVLTDLILTNQGDETVHISSIESTNSIYQVADTTFDLEPGARFVARVTCQPTGANYFNGYLRVYHNAPNLNNPWSIYIETYAYNRHFIPVEPTGLPYAIILNQVRVDGHPLFNPSDIGVFDGDLCVGEVYSGGESENLQVTVWQSNPDEGLNGFSIGDSIEFRIHTTAYDSALDIRPAVTWLTGDGTFGNGPFSSANLAGSSTLEPRSELTPSTLMFGLVPVQVGDTLAFSIENNGETSLWISNWNNSSSVFTPLSSPTTIPAHQSLEVPVWFHPDNASWYTGDLYFDTNDPDRPQYHVHFSGGGTVAETASLYLDNVAVNFGDIPLTDTVTIELMLRNRGNVDLRITDIQSNSAAVWTNTDSLTIAPGAAQMVAIEGHPVSAGNFTAQLNIVSNSADADYSELNLCGYGFQAYFDPIPATGQSYQVVISGLIDSANLGFREGDEIAVFDGVQCVGRTVYHTGPLSLAAWKRDAEHDLAGFMDGDLMLFKYHSTRSDSDYNIQALDAIPTIIQGDGTFGAGPFAEVELEINGTSTPLEPYGGPVYWVSVDRGVDYLNNGEFNQPFHSIQYALNIAASGDTIWVESGLYREALDFKGRDVVLQSVSGPDSTIISKPGTGPLLTINQGETAATVIEGFQITGAATSGNGGGIFIENASPSLVNLNIHDNVSSGGGGLYLNHSQSQITDCVIRHNRADANGGGLALAGASSQITVRRTRIEADSAGTFGGGVMIQAGVNADFEHVLVTGNQADQAGGFYNLGQITWRLSTIAGNTSGLYSGGYSGEWVSFNSSILFNNTPSEVEWGSDGAVLIQFSDLQLDSTANHNLNLDPRFVNPAAGDFHLAGDSPCINTGDPAADFQAEPEPNGDRMNMGYYGATPDAASADLRLPLPAELNALEDHAFEFGFAYEPDSNVVFSSALITSPVWLNFDADSNLIFGTPQNQNVGDTLFAIQGWDNFNRRDTLLVTLHVANTNDAPLIVSQPDTMLWQDSLWLYPIQATDPDVGDSLVYSILQSPDGLVINESLHRLEWEPVNAEVGEHILEFSVTDDSGAVAVQSADLVVQNVNDPPELTSALDSIFIVEDAPDFALLLGDYFTDIDQTVVFDSLLYSATVSDTDLLRINLAGDTLNIHPVSNAFGTAEIGITATDLAGANLTVPLYVQIAPVNDSPGIFHLISPDSITFPEYTDSLEFTWTQSLDPDPGDTLHYTISISETPEFNIPIITATTSDTSILIASNALVQDLVYYWRVTVQDIAGLGNSSTEIFQFVLNFANSPPATPVTIAPEPGAILTVQPQLSWHTVTDPDLDDTIHFECQISRFMGFGDTLAFYSGQDTLWTVPDTAGLLENDLHYWRVRALDVGGLASQWSVTGTFYLNVTNEPPSSPDLIAPLQIATGTRLPTLIWSSSLDPDPSEPAHSTRYAVELWVGIDSLKYLTTGDDTTLTLTDSLVEDGYYYWHVAARDTAGLSSAWSTSGYFGVNQYNRPPDGYSLVYPTGGDTVYAEPLEIRWHSTVDPDAFDMVVQYIAELSRTRTFSQIISVPAGTDTATTNLPQLHEDRWYFWQVLAYDSWNAVEVTPVDSFYVNMIPNQPPVAQWMIPDSVIHGIAALPYQATDPDSQVVSVAVDYRLASETIYHPATIDSTATDENIISWNTGADIPDYYGAVWLRITPFDGEDFGVADSLRILVDNVAPAVTVLPLTGTFHDSVQFSYVLTNDPVSPVELTFYYSRMAPVNWTEINPNHFSEIPPLELNASHTITWYSDLDLPASLGDSLRLLVECRDYSAMSSAASDPFIIVNNFAPTVSINPMFNWYHDIVPVALSYNDPDGDAPSFSLLYSVDGMNFLPATIIAGPTAASKSPIPSPGLRRTSKPAKKAPRAPKSFAENTVNISAASITSAGDTTLYWNSRADLPGDYIWFVWLAVAAEDVQGATAADTLNTLVDNYRPRVSIVLPSGEISRDISIQGTFHNDTLHTATITALFQINGEANWENSSFRYYPGAGDTVFSTVWHSQNDLPFGFDGQVKLRFFAYDSVDTSDFADFSNIHIDNNDVPEISAINPSAASVRGDIVFEVVTIDPELDSLTFSMKYSYDNGDHLTPTSHFSTLRDTDSLNIYYLTWNSFDDALNYYDTDVRIAITPADLDVGPETVSNPFILDNRGGPRLARVLNSEFPAFLWTDTLKLAFSASLTPSTIPNAISLLYHGAPLNYQWWLIDDSTKLYLDPATLIPPLDSLKLKITSALTGNTGLAFDGNDNYLPDGAADSLVVTTYTPMVADFSGDGLLNAEDFVAFVTNWNRPEPNLKYDIGPASGELPYTTFTPDGLFDFEDLMVFIAMWKWDHNRTNALAKVNEQENPPEIPLSKDYRITTTGIITDEGQSIATISLNSQVDAPLPALIKWEVAGLDSQNFAMGTAWSSHFNTTTELMDGAARLIAGLTPDSEQLPAGHLVESSATVEKPTEVTINIRLWDIKGRELARTSHVIWINPATFIPQTYYLHQNYPNPFNTNTVLEWGLPDETRVNVSIYSLRGELVRTIISRKASAGQYRQVWDGKNQQGQPVASGIYLINLRTPNFSRSIKTVYLK